MQKKLLAVAVAGALIAPAAFAQTSVTISGALNLTYSSDAATGATVGGAGDIKTRDRIQDGAGSNLRFTIVEDIGGGMQAFGQLESAVFNNADTRNNAVGVGANNTNGWSSRNSGIGLRSNAWGEILLGIWDIHYHEHYAADSHIIRGTSSSNSLGLLNTFGTQGIATATTLPAIGGRYSNVIRYQSPSWSGFNFRVAYSRPTDGNVPNIPNQTATGNNLGNDTKNRVWNFSPSYSAGPLFLGYSYLKDKDIAVGTATALWAGNAAITAPAVGAGATVAAATVYNTTTAAALPANAANTAGVTGALWNVTSNRFMGAYTFPMGFKIGFIFDRSKLDGSYTIAAAPGSVASNIQRDVWALPLAYTAGAHQVHFVYGKAKSWKGNIAGVDVGNIAVAPPTITAATGAATTAGVIGAGNAQTVGGNTGARMISLGYQYDLSKRTNLHLTYAQIRNDSLAGYDFFSMSSGMAAGSYGADPRTIGIGLRHAF